MIDSQHNAGVFAETQAGVETGMPFQSAKQRSAAASRTRPEGAGGELKAESNLSGGGKMEDLQQSAAGLEDAILKLVQNTITHTMRAAAALSASAIPTAPTPVSAALLSTGQVAERCAGIHPKTVVGWIRSGRLAASKPGRTYLVEPAELERFLRAQQTRTVKAPDADDESARIFKRLQKSG